MRALTCVLAGILLNVTPSLASPPDEACEGLRTLADTADLSSLKGPEMGPAWRATLQVPGMAGVVVAEVEGSLVALVGVELIEDAGSESNALRAADAAAGLCLGEQGWRVLPEESTPEKSGNAWVKPGAVNGIRVTLQRPFEQMPPAAYLVITPGLSPKEAVEPTQAPAATWLHGTVMRVGGEPGERTLVRIQLRDGSAPEGSLVQFRGVRLIDSATGGGSFPWLHVWGEDAEQVIEMKGRAGQVQVCPLPCNDDGAWARVASQRGDWVIRGVEEEERVEAEAEQEQADWWALNTIGRLVSLAPWPDWSSDSFAGMGPRGFSCRWSSEGAIHCGLAGKLSGARVRALINQRATYLLAKDGSSDTWTDEHGGVTVTLDRIGEGWGMSFRK